MEPDQGKGKGKGKGKDGQAPREEFEVAFYTKELGRSLQRKLLQRRFSDLGDSSITPAGHGEDAPGEPDAGTPRDDRAG